MVGFNADLTSKAAPLAKNPDDMRLRLTVAGLRAAAGLKVGESSAPTAVEPQAQLAPWRSPAQLNLEEQLMRARNVARAATASVAENQIASSALAHATERQAATQGGVALGEDQEVMPV